MCISIRKHLIKKQFENLGIDVSKIDWSRYGVEY